MIVNITTRKAAVSAGRLVALHAQMKLVPFRWTAGCPFLGLRHRNSGLSCLVLKERERDIAKLEAQLRLPRPVQPDAALAGRIRRHELAA